MTRWILTCEHGGHRVPAAYARLFADAGQVLVSHRGWDPGALCAFRRIAARLADASWYSEVTRLLVDLNRSEGHPRLFSEYTRGLPPSAREEILERHYRPWRRRAEACIARWRTAGEEVVHVSVHSFTPALDGRSRNADVGLLYDPSRAAERVLCEAWRHALRELDPGLRVRLNYPYRGTADGFTRFLRGRFDQGYAGIELELNQALVGRRCIELADLAGTALLRVAGGGSVAG